MEKDFSVLMEKRERQIYIIIYTSLNRVGNTAGFGEKGIPEVSELLGMIQKWIHIGGLHLNSQILLEIGVQVLAFCWPWACDESPGSEKRLGNDPPAWAGSELNDGGRSFNGNENHIMKLHQVVEAWSMQFQESECPLGRSCSPGSPVTLPEAEGR